MILNILDLYLRQDKSEDGQLVGYLFRYGHQTPQEHIRFVPAESYVANVDRPILSMLYSASSEENFQTVMRDIFKIEFNGVLLQSKDSGGPPTESTSLPAWFQNLLPEGVFRQHIAELRGCAENDYFEIFAACGADLPGAIYAKPHPEGDMRLNQHLVTQGQDAYEMSVVEIPMIDGISLSGVQPKLGVDLVNGRYVARTRLSDATRVIAKLPTAKYVAMPEVEHLSMQLAGLAGANVCATSLQSLNLLDVAHSYDLSGLDDDRQKFLAVPRYDRNGEKRVHAEDFAQVFGVMPHDKYTKKYSYARVMEYMLAIPSLGIDAVQELIRRVTINELVGNPDCHLKNIGLYYPDGVTPMLPPAYDIVAHHVYTRTRGHALYILPSALQLALNSKRTAERTTAGADAHRIPRVNSILDPELQRLLADYLSLPVRQVSGPIKTTCTQAASAWPPAIEASEVTPIQKAKMLVFLNETLTP